MCLRARPRRPSPTSTAWPEPPGIRGGSSPHGLREDWRVRAMSHARPPAYRRTRIDDKEAGDGRHGFGAVRDGGDRGRAGGPFGGLLPEEGRAVVRDPGGARPGRGLVAHALRLPAAVHAEVRGAVP